MIKREDLLSTQPHRSQALQSPPPILSSVRASLRRKVFLGLASLESLLLNCPSWRQHSLDTGGGECSHPLMCNDLCDVMWDTHRAGSSHWTSYMSSKMGQHCKTLFTPLSHAFSVSHIWLGTVLDQRPQHYSLGDTEHSGQVSQTAFYVVCAYLLTQLSDQRLFCPSCSTCWAQRQVPAWGRGAVPSPDGMCPQAGTGSSLQPVHHSTSIVQKLLLEPVQRREKDHHISPVC